ncbi:anti-restriction [Cyanophage S-TIM54]|nr:anti-restriction [Cyanophage S-TIM54]
MTTIEELRPVPTSTTKWLGQLPDHVLPKVQELVNDEGYPISDIREFIEEFGYNNFISGYYETWADLTDHYDDDAIRAFVDEYSVRDIESFEDAYYGQYSTVTEFVQEFMDAMGDEVPNYVVVDYIETWNRNLRFDFDFVDGYIFNKNW